MVVLPVRLVLQRLTIVRVCDGKVQIVVFEEAIGAAYQLFFAAPNSQSAVTRDFSAPSGFARRLHCNRQDHEGLG